jgi:hypothetical protein
MQHISHTKELADLCNLFDHFYASDWIVLAHAQSTTAIQLPAPSLRLFHVFKCDAKCTNVTDENDTKTSGRTSTVCQPCLCQPSS